MWNFIVDVFAVIGVLSTAVIIYFVLGLNGFLGWGR